jgi:hypothetical protein
VTIPALGMCERGYISSHLGQLLAAGRIRWRYRCREAVRLVAKIEKFLDEPLPIPIVHRRRNPLRFVAELTQLLTNSASAHDAFARRAASAFYLVHSVSPPLLGKSVETSRQFQQSGLDIFSRSRPCHVAQPVGSCTQRGS